MAKEHLDVALLEERRQVPNSKSAIVRLVQRFQSVGFQLQVICEASGGYERSLVRALQRSRVPVTLVQPNRPLRSGYQTSGHCGTTPVVSAIA